MIKLSELIAQGVVFTTETFSTFVVYRFVFPDGSVIVHSTMKKFELLWRDCPLCNDNSVGLEFHENDVVEFRNDQSIDPAKVHFCESCQKVIANYNKIRKDLEVL